MSQDLKRQNFNVDADQAAVLEAARAHLGASTMKDAIVRAARLVNTLANELQGGKRLLTSDAAGNTTRILIPELESPRTWQYLSSRPHPWRTQLYIKGRRILASNIWFDMLANDMTAEEIAEDRELPLAVVLEAIAYCEQNRDLIELESAEEKRLLIEAGVILEPQAAA